MGKSLIKMIVLWTAVMALSLSSSIAGADSRSYRRSLEQYRIPDVTLINQEGKNVRIKSIIESGKIVVVDFIYGTCTTICPVLSASFINLQQRLGTDLQKVQLVSVSIDPENDSPRVMREYLRRYRARPGWDFLTGSRKDIDAVMHGFDAYIPNKMSHYAVTFISTRKSNSWVRINGIMSSSELLEEVKKAGQQ